jgi:dynein heavy chain
METIVVSVDFVLRDPREKDEDKKESLPPHREELAVVPKPWNKTYIQNRQLAMENLHVTNPCMLQVLQLWHTAFK